MPTRAITPATAPQIFICSGAKPGGAGVAGVYSTASAGEPSTFPSLLFTSMTGAGVVQSADMYPALPHQQQERASAGEVQSADMCPLLPRR